MSSPELLYEGKAKKIFRLAGEPDHVLMEFKDSLTAFNALKKGSFDSKGPVNRDIASLIFAFLRGRGVDSHWVRDEGERGMVARRVEIIPLEVVVRNVLAGSTAKKLGLEEGRVLPRPLVEFYFKNDELQDPFVSDDQIEILGIASAADLAELKKQALRVNEGLKDLFHRAGLRLVDFKIEFGRDKAGKILLADEITPDCCRLWDEKTNEKMDKDRFRRDLGQVKESYEQVLQRLRQIGGGK
ncbi:MAG: phosphoribosylaminoimidazolesuccinocarboxamide synthase [Bdellovibrionaceae bacterium]|nr:phosphoribosylaminoimidazolesuccinocarboxamide synthase [Pseudobdellovibrionaceae bacterium]